MGGKDSKLIVLSKDGRSVTDFSMNSVCAAGTGSFLDQQAERLRLTIDEFSELALKSKKPPRIAPLDYIRVIRDERRFDGSKAEKELGLTYTPIRDTLREAIEFLK